MWLLLLGESDQKYYRDINVLMFLIFLLWLYASGRPIIVDFSPVTDFREATCRQYEENTCNRGGYCNFMHLKKISRCVSVYFLRHSSFF